MIATDITITTITTAASRDNNSARLSPCLMIMIADLIRAASVSERLRSPGKVRARLGGGVYYAEWTCGYSTRPSL